MPSFSDLSVAFAASLAVATSSLTARLVARMPARRMATWLPWLQACAAGLLLGDALLHMVPEALARGIGAVRTMNALALGMLGLVCVECAVRAIDTAASTAVFARMNVVGDALHHVADGIVIGASFAIDRTLGIAIALAIMAHALPREMSNAGVLLAGGYTPRRAFGLSLATTAGLPVGALGIMLLGHDQPFLGTSLALAAGTAIYLACGDLLPGLWQNLQRRHRFTPALGMAGGLVFMWLAAGIDHAR